MGSNFKGQRRGNGNGGNGGNGGGYQPRPEMTDEQRKQHFESLKNSLDARLQAIALSLPPRLVKDRDPQREAVRLVGRAVMTFARDPNLCDCPIEDFVRCVIEAAEFGYAIDGKMCYVVPYGGKKKGVAKKWSLQFDYKALVGIARHAGVIDDVQAEVICKNDRYVYKRKGPKVVFFHQRPPVDEPRGDVIGAYAIFFLTGGGHKIEVVDLEELTKFEQASPGRENGPWAGPWKSEMQKKAVVRRGIKLYCDDPGFIHALDIDDGPWKEQEEEEAPASFAALNAQLTAPAGLPQPSAREDFQQQRDQQQDRRLQQETVESGRRQQETQHDREQEQEYEPGGDGDDEGGGEGDDESRDAEQDAASLMKMLRTSLPNCKNEQDVIRLEDHLWMIAKGLPNMENFDMELANACNQRRGQIADERSKS